MDITDQYLFLIDVQGEEKVKTAKKSVDELSESLGRGGGGRQNLGYAALEASRALEDLQYGVGGVVNNIPGLVMALGGTAGLTAVISLVAVGVNQLVKHWDEWVGGADRAKQASDELKQSLKEQADALKALEEVQTAQEKREKAARVEGVPEAVAPHREEIRKALAEDIRIDLNVERERLTEEIFGRLPKEQRDFTGLMQDPRFARVWRRIGQEQQEADLIIGRALKGSQPDLGRLQGLFGQETEIGARLAEAGPERTKQRAEEARDVAQQQRMARLNEQLRQNQDRQRKEQERSQEQFAQGWMGDEEAALRGQQQVDQRARQRDAQQERQQARAQQQAAKQQAEQERAQERAAREQARMEAEIIRENARMTREFARQQQEYVRMLREAQEDLNSANQWNGKTGGL